MANTHPEITDLTRSRDEAAYRRVVPALRSLDLILVDLNLPKLDGSEVLVFIKEVTNLRNILTVIQTAAVRFLRSYQLRASAYPPKPMPRHSLEGIVRSIGDFWLTQVKLPQRPN